MLDVYSGDEPVHAVIPLSGKIVRPAATVIKRRFSDRGTKRPSARRTAVRATKKTPVGVQRDGRYGAA